jgi:hypothetical protein
MESANLVFILIINYATWKNLGSARIVQMGVFWLGSLTILRDVCSAWLRAIPEDDVRLDKDTSPHADILVTDAIIQTNLSYQTLSPSESVVSPNQIELGTIKEEIPTPEQVRKERIKKFKEWNLWLLSSQNSQLAEKILPEWQQWCIIQEYKRDCKTIEEYIDNPERFSEEVLPVWESIKLVFDVLAPCKWISPEIIHDIAVKIQSLEDTCTKERKKMEVKELFERMYNLFFDAECFVGAYLLQKVIDKKKYHYPSGYVSFH